MKNKVIILLTLLLFVSCSQLQKNETGAEKKYEILLNEWKLSELEESLERDVSFNIDNKIIEKYKILLQEKKENKKELIVMIEEIRNKLQLNDIEGIKQYFGDTFINKKILSELNNIDFSQIKIVYTQPIFYKNSAKNKVAFIFIDEVRYFQFTYKLSNKKWKIVKIEDGR